ncbi:MAG: hypothetical protein ACRD52_00730 [Candidatus Acidiferrales bacterium]
MPAPQQQAEQDWKDFTYAEFGGLDTSSDPTAIRDQDFSWLFDMMPIGNGFLPVVPGPTSFASGLNACQWIDYANIGGVDYAVHLNTSGALNLVNISTGAETSIVSGLTPASCQTATWSNSALLIIDSTVGYSYWTPGGGYVLSDATIKGYSIAVHQGRVWILNGRSYTFSAPASYTDFTTSSGGGSGALNDPTIQGNAVALFERESILYIIGQTSVNEIGTLTVPTGSTAPVFSVSNLQSSVGTPYLRAIAELQRVIFLTGPAGVYGVYGVNAPKLSDPLNGILANFSPINGQFHSGIGNAFNQLIFAFLGSLTHPNYTGPALACFVNKKWFLSEQGSTLSAICSGTVQGVPTMLGADSEGKLWRLFTNLISTRQARVDQKLFSPFTPIYDHEIIRGGVLVNWTQADTAEFIAVSDSGTQSSTLSVNNQIAFTGSDGQPFVFTGSDSKPLTWYALGAALLKAGFQIRGKHIGLSLRMTASGNWVRAFMMRLRRATPW